MGTGFNYETLALLQGEFKKIRTSSAPFTIERMEHVTWIEPKLVYEVIYLVVTRDCKLRAPCFHRLRIDKLPKECTLDQIAEKGKCFKK